MKCIAALFLLTVIFLSSCSHRNEAIELTRDFFTSLSDTTYGKPSYFYPLYDSLRIVAKSDAIDIEESDVLEKNDSIEVRCLNNYTDDKGKFRQDSVVIFITKDKYSEWFIYNSRGLVTVDKDTEWFGRRTGTFTKKTLNDLELADKLNILGGMMVSKYWELFRELRTKVVIQNWSWETSYDGTAHGEARIKNNLPYSIDGVKYHITYYDRQGNYMAEDDGKVSKSLNPGEKYSFTFWSSNAKYPSTANLRLDFSDKLIRDLLKQKNYTGKEFEEYSKQELVTVQ